VSGFHGFRISEWIMDLPSTRRENRLANHVHLHQLRIRKHLKAVTHVFASNGVEVGQKVVPCSGNHRHVNDDRRKEYMFFNYLKISFLTLC
jgi:hypothetical protein